MLIVGTACLAATAMAATFTRTATRARGLDRAVRLGSAFLDAVSLWTRADLERHLGDRAEGPWRLRIDRPGHTLFTIVLRDSSGAELLSTSLFRADTSNVAR
jgi:hypothetical protein